MTGDLTSEPGGGGDDLAGYDSPGTDLEAAGGALDPLDIVDGELIDDEPDEVEGEVLSGGADVEVWAVTDNPGAWGWGTPADPGAPARSEHGARPGGGPSSPAGPKQEGRGLNPFSGRRRRGRGGTGGGSGTGVNVSVFGGIANGASLIRANVAPKIGSDNAGVKVQAGGRRPAAGRRRPL